jgi:hypothetical protein
MTLLVIGVVLVIVATWVAYLGLMRAGEELTDDRPSRVPRSERAEGARGYAVNRWSTDPGPRAHGLSPA